MAVLNEHIGEMVLKVGAALPQLVFNVSELISGNTIFSGT